jgi:hypothetical protein
MELHSTNGPYAARMPSRDGATEVQVSIDPFFLKFIEA